MINFLKLVACAIMLTASVSQAQTVNVNGANCSGASVSFSAGAINIYTAGCSGTTVTLPPIIITPPPPPPPPIIITPPPPTPIASNISIDGVNLPSPSKYAFVVPGRHSGVNGAGPEVNAYAMNPARCATFPLASASWQHNIDLADYKGKNAFDFFVMQANEILSYKFTVGSADASGGFIYNDGANALVRPTYISITLDPCDFDAAKPRLPGQAACFQTGLNGNSVNWANITGELPAAYCRLVKGQTYYMNLRFQDARPAAQGGSPFTDACPSGNCGGIIQVL